MRLIGDIHGKIEPYIQTALTYDTVQIGDFGIGFLHNKDMEKVNKFHTDGNHRFIRGNHDDPEKCKSVPGYIPDGMVEGETMFIGGAYSVDVMVRTAGLDWWPDEELGMKELHDLSELYKEVRPRVMITHTCPHSVAKQLFGDRARWPITKTKTCDAFDYMLEIHEPDLWVFGHWHISKKQKIGKTEFVCLNVMEYMDI